MRTACSRRGRGLTILLCLLACAGQACAEFFYRDGDRPILFLGDSITDRTPYPIFIETYLLTRFPTWSIACRNVGWSGDTATLRQRGGFDHGLKRDILPHAPKAITIDFGMNDARGGEAALTVFIDHTTKLVRQLKAAGARVALLTPSPEERYEADQPAGSAYNQMLAKYSLALRAIAEKEGVPLVDQHTPYVQLIEAGRKAGVLSATSAGPRLIPDGVHPNFSGHLVMAVLILKGLEAPALVSRVEVNGAARTVTAAEGCTVELRDGDGLIFSRLDAALPWFIPAEARLAMKIPGFSPLRDLNRYELKVTHLPAARYDLRIDAVTVGTFTKEDLAAGLNLALAAGPITAQSQQIWEVAVHKTGLYWRRWREVQLFPVPTWLAGPDLETRRQAELTRLDGLIAECEKQLTTLRQPTAHTWTLTPATP